jgi:hypothetical protein
MQAHILICDLYNLNKCYYYPTFSYSVLGYTYPFCLYRTIIIALEQMVNKFWELDSFEKETVGNNSR